MISRPSRRARGIHAARFAKPRGCVADTVLREQPAGLSDRSCRSTPGHAVRVARRRRASSAAGRRADSQSVPAIRMSSDQHRRGRRTYRRADAGLSHHLEVRHRARFGQRRPALLRARPRRQWWAWLKVRSCAGATSDSSGRIGVSSGWPGDHCNGSKRGRDGSVTDRDVARVVVRASPCTGEVSRSSFARPSGIHWTAQPALVGQQCSSGIAA